MSTDSDTLRHVSVQGVLWLKNLIESFDRGITV